MSDVASVAVASLKNILLIDDDRQLLQLAKVELVTAGHQVAALSDFQAARNYLAFNAPDVIISDVRLGAFNGLQLVVLAKTINPAVIAIVMTGFDDPVTRADAERIGAHFLLKPVTSAVLLNSIR